MSSTERRKQITNLRLAQSRIGPAAAAVRSRVFVMGGVGKEGFNTTVEVIADANGPSPQIAPLSGVTLLGRCYVSAAAVGDEIFLFGGLCDTGVTDAVECFNSVTGKVTRRAPMPAPRRSTGVIAVGNYIFVVGGSDKGGGSVPTMAVYDTKRDKWGTAPPMRVGRECAAAFWNGWIVVPGGYDGKNALSVCEAYSVDQARWTALPALPLETSANHLAVVGDKLWSFGDYAEPKRVLSFDLKRALWSVPTDVPYQPSRHNAVVALGRRVYVIGGNVTSAGYGLDLVQVVTV